MILEFYRILFMTLNFISLGYLLFYSKRRTVDTVIVLICYAYTFGYDYRLFGMQLAHILLLSILLLGWSINGQKRSAAIIKNVTLLYLGYVIPVTFIGYYFIRDYKVIGSVLQNELRPIMQSAQTVVLFLVFLVVLKFGYEDSREVIDCYRKMLLFIAVLGTIQWLLYLFFKIDIFPMDRGYALSVETEHLHTLRATAFQGEPKQLGKLMSIGVALEIFYGKYINHGRTKWRRVIFFVIVNFMSASTTGVLIIAFALMLDLYAELQKYGLGFIAIIIAMAIIPLLLHIPFVYDKIMYRVVELKEIPGLEDTDTAVVRWLAAEPLHAIFGVGIGNTVGYAYTYVPERVAYIAKFPFSLRRGLVQYMGEGGIVGTIMLCYIFYTLIRKARAVKEIKYCVVFLVCMNLFLTVGSIAGVELLLMGLVSNIGYERQEQCCTNTLNCDADVKRWEIVHVRGTI